MSQHKKKHPHQAKPQMVYKVTDDQTKLSHNARVHMMPVDKPYTFCVLIQYS